MKTIADEIAAYWAAVETDRENALPFDPDAPDIADDWVLSTQVWNQISAEARHAIQNPAAQPYGGGPPEELPPGWTPSPPTAPVDC